MLIGVVVLRKRSSRFPSHQVTSVLYSLRTHIFTPQKMAVKSNILSILTSTTRGVLLSILKKILESYLENTSLGMLLTLPISIKHILSQSSSTQHNKTHKTQNTRNECKAKFPAQKTIEDGKAKHCSLNLNDDSGELKLS